MPYFRECKNLHESKICHLAQSFHGGLHVFTGGYYVNTKMHFHESCYKPPGKLFVAGISWRPALTKIIFQTWRHNIFRGRRNEFPPRKWIVTVDSHENIVFVKSDS